MSQCPHHSDSTTIQNFGRTVLLYFSPLLLRSTRTLDPSCPASLFLSLRKRRVITKIRWVWGCVGIKEGEWSQTRCDGRMHVMPGRWRAQWGTHAVRGMRQRIVAQIATGHAARGLRCPH